MSNKNINKLQTSKMLCKELLLILGMVCFTTAMDANAPLRLLDHRIYDEISEPTITPGRGDLLLKEMIAYYCNMLDVFNYLKFKNKKGLDMVDELESEGGPRVPKMEVNGNAIKEAYKWDEKDLEVLTTMLQSIKTLWGRVTDKMYLFGDGFVEHRL